MQPLVVEPVDGLLGGELNVLEAVPGLLVADQFGFVQPMEGLGRACGSYRP